MKIISGYVRIISATGTCTVPAASRPIYAIPSHFDSLFNCGGQWIPLWTNPSITQPAYQRSIITTTDATGRFIIEIPSESETYQPDSLSVSWTIIDPTTQVAFTGIVTDGIPSAGIDLKTLLQSYDWIMTPSNVISLGAANLRLGFIDFDQSTGAQQIVTLIPPMPTASYAPTVSGATDDLTDLNYSAFVLPGWTTTQFVVRIDAVPPIGRTVRVPYIAIG